MLVQIFIPTYNRREHLLKALTAIASQTYDNWIVDVIDNASTDGSVEMLHHEYRSWVEQGKLRIHRYDELVPIIANWNRYKDHIIEEAELTKFLWSDDTLLPDFLATVVPEFLDPNIAAVGTDIRYIDAAGSVVGLRKYAGSRFAFIASSCFRNMLGCPSSTIMRSHVFNSIRFDETNRYVADLKFLMDGVRSPRSFIHIRHVGVEVQLHENTETYQLFASPHMLENKKQFALYSANEYFSKNPIARCLAVLAAVAFGATAWIRGAMR